MLNGTRQAQQGQIEMVRELLLVPGQKPCIPPGPQEQAVLGAFGRQLECSSAHDMRGEKGDPGSTMHTREQRRLRARCSMSTHTAVHAAPVSIRAGRFRFPLAS